MDFTYKCNMTIMILDGEGQSRPVFHAFVARPSWKTVSVSWLNNMTPPIPVVLLLIKTWRRKLPLGQLSFHWYSCPFCHFLISQAVELFLKRRDSKALADIILNSFMNQVTTESEHEFLQLKRQISEITTQAVIDYFEDNWWVKRHLWATCCSINIVQLHTMTTNALKSSIQK
ncbi:hypothetical protein PoB_005450700 [Plakobranchus ocellatus]|uniref:Uncharacterized protein n=1 Tax=Plakobranchus ocellatus TaxID=259542 RepID=A0AAV4C917_9GAST|nr:hypothetical protein PoB_005450700 [Plakobranchus ocellatus]